MTVCRVGTGFSRGAFYANGVMQMDQGNMFLNKQRYELCFAIRYIRVTCINNISK